VRHASSQEQEQNSIDRSRLTFDARLSEIRVRKRCADVFAVSLELPRETTSGEGGDGLNLGMIGREQRRMLRIVMDGWVESLLDQPLSFLSD